MADGPPISAIDRIGDYRVESILGQGGMGEVFLAWDERLHRHVAIKRIRADLPLDGCQRSRFRREARAAARLSHPAIVQVFDLVETEDGDCIVMERVEGRSLTEVIAAEEVDLELALRLGAEIAEGLAEAHSKGLIHRDLKPENVIVTSLDHAKILDFGLARMLWSEGVGESDDPSAALTQAGVLVGTVHAMSPEQASGRPVDHRSDLFAFGGLLYEMLTGQAPFRGGNWLDTLRRVTSEEPESLSSLCPAAPAALVELVKRLLAKDPDVRPQNARVVADELEQLRSSVPTRGSDGALGPATTVVPTISPAPLPSPAEVADLHTGEWAPPAANPEPSSIIRVLMLTDLVDSTRMVETLGDSRTSEVWACHDRAARDLLARFDGLEIDKSDGFFFLFERPADAVGYALAYHQALDRLSQELAVELRARVGIHLGEVVLRRNTPRDVSRGAKPLEVEGLAKPTVARVASLAGSRQTLLTRGVFDLARRAAVGGDLADDQVRWLAHGTFLLKGVEEPLEVCEVGVKGFAPLREPPDSEKVRRAVAIGDELTLGWRPAAGQAIPRRDNWTLEARLAEGGFGEVWLARHKSGERRAFKFCFEAERLRALKREVTLFRLLKDALGHRDDIARILDWHFDEAPYFVESEYTEGGNLVEWAAEQGGLDHVPLALRLELAAEVAEALGAAHSVGILHKDVKPENVLITLDREGRPRARLTDFGIGLLTERERLDAPGFTALGFTETMTPTADSGAGTLGYLAPELVQGKAATIQADVYSLGVLLYQLVAGDFSCSLAPGWRRDVADEILAEDLAFFVDGRPERRPSSALEVAERLRTLEVRRERRTAEHRAREEAERSRRLRRVWGTVAAVAAVFLLVVSVLAIQAIKARGDANQRRLQAENLADFMLFDLHESLESLGRLDLLSKVAEKAQAYLEAQPPDQDSPQAAHRRGISLLNTADVLLDQGQTERAIDGYHQARLIFESVLRRGSIPAEWRRDLAISSAKLGEALVQRGDTHTAVESFNRALADVNELPLSVSQDPESRLTEARIRLQLGQLLVGQRQPEQASKELEAALAATRAGSPAPEAPWRYWRVVLDIRYELGMILVLLGRTKEAADGYREALPIAKQLAADDPTNLNGRSQLARMQYMLATALTLNGQIVAGIAVCESARREFQALAKEDETHVRWRLQLGEANILLGILHGMGGGYDEATAAFLAARATAEELIALDPASAAAGQLLAFVYHEVGNDFWELGETNRALESYKTAAEIVAAGLARAPNDRGWSFIKGATHIYIGHARAALDEPVAARSEWVQAVRVLEPLRAEFPEGREVYTHVWALLALGRLDEARLSLAAVPDIPLLDQRFRDLLRQHGLTLAGSSAKVGARS